MTGLLRTIVRLGSAVLLFGALNGCGQSELAPDSTFVLLDGSTIRTQDLRGKVVLVNFWATTCTSCVAEMPELIATHEKFAARGFETVAVAMSYDTPAFVNRFAQSRQLPFKVSIDVTGSAAKAWGEVRLTPTTYLVDKNGHVVKRFVGPPEFDALHQLIDELLKAPQA
jgi:peroxiredoxin